MYKPLLLATLIASSFSAYGANDADLAAIREQIGEMKKTYEQRIAALEQKLAAAESRKETAPRVVAAAESPSERRSIAPATSFNPEVSLILQGQYKNMKDVSERGVTGFWPAGGHNHGAGTIEGINKRGFSMDHTELVLSANVDPNWRARAIFAMLDGQAEVEEAWFQSIGLGNGMGLKAGRYRSGIGYLNEQHPHMWDFAGAPLMYQAMFGPHGSYVQDGVQAKWVAPTKLFIELGAEAGRGHTFPGSDRNKNGAGSGAIFAHIGGDVGASNSWRAGLSYLRTQTAQREGEAHSIGLGDHAPVVYAGNSRTFIADFVWKWAPNGNPKYQNFKFQTEYFHRKESGNLSCFDNAGICDEEANGTLSLLDTYRRNQSGWYAQGVYQFAPSWRAGLRHEQMNSGNPRIGAGVFAQIEADSDLFRHFKPKKSSAMIDYSWSEFSRVRLQYAQDKSMLGITDNQVTLQYIMSLGAHGAHKF